MWNVWDMQNGFSVAMMAVKSFARVESTSNSVWQKVVQNQLIKHKKPTLIPVPHNELACEIPFRASTKLFEVRIAWSSLRKIMISSLVE